MVKHPTLTKWRREVNPGSNPGGPTNWNIAQPGESVRLIREMSWVQILLFQQQGTMAEWCHKTEGSGLQNHSHWFESS